MKWILISFATICFAATNGMPQGNITSHSSGNDRTMLRFSHGSSDYAVVNFKESWFAAKYYCKWSGMELASIETEEEQNAITEATSSLNEPLWVSLNDLYKYNFFVWESTGELAEFYVNWNAGEPSIGDDCGYLGTPFSAERRWFVDDCYDTNLNKKYLCEKPRDIC